MTRRRRGWWVLGVYAAMLAASHAVQMIGDDSPPRAEDRPSVMIELNGRTLHVAYTEAGGGEGTPLLLLHGSPGSADDFRRLMPHLATDRRVVAVDLPGFGRSTLRAGDYGIDAHAEAVSQVMDALMIDRAHLLGFSMGSGPALHLTILAPRRVASLIFYGGIGLQEHEGSGDYRFEHFKYRVGYAGLVVLPEFVPHFGLLGSRARRHAFIRNFMDTDQRPLRGLLENYAGPMLILHGRDDPLVPARAAYAHHALVPQSELVMFDDSHFMLFDDAKAKRLADEIVPFLARAESGQVQRRTVDHTAARPPAATLLPIGIDLRTLSPWTQIGAIVLSSYVLEDPTTVMTGLLVRQGQLDAFVALTAIVLGIFSGDLALYLIGWVAGRRALRWRPVARRLPVHQVEALGRWFDRHGWYAVLASRFIPGTRLPLYVAAGSLGKKPVRFAVWTLLAVAIWAPVMLVLVMVLGEAAASPLRAVFGERSWLAAIALLVLMVVMLRVLTLSATHIGRARLAAWWGRWLRPEFWPAWLFYAPVVPWYAWLSLRHRSFTVWTLANPGIPEGGVVGESKHAILMQLPEPGVVPSAILRAEGDRMGALQRLVSQRGWSLPLVLKPDSGQRGAGVKLIRTWDDARRHLDTAPGDLLVQTYHPGPHEAGVFYWRHPGQMRGHILAITDKVFPVIEGDGRHTLEQLIWRHRRYRMQASVFLRRHELQRDRVLERGERLTLAMAGNHCQGTLFRDGSHLDTEALRQRLDDLLCHFRGFNIGRFDLRYSDPEAFKRGEDLAIVELNGVTSEATAIYDPDWTLVRRYRLLLRQWSLLFEIGAAVRDQARTRPIGVIALLRLIRAYYRGRVVETVSD